MTKQQAHALLNAVQAGFPASRGEITAALMVTGDLDRPEAVKAGNLVFHTTTTIDPTGKRYSHTEVIA